MIATVELTTEATAFTVDKVDTLARLVSTHVDQIAGKMFGIEGGLIIRYLVSVQIANIEGLDIYRSGLKLYCPVPYIHSKDTIKSEILEQILTNLDGIVEGYGGVHASRILGIDIRSATEDGKWEGEKPKMYVKQG